MKTIPTELFRFERCKLGGYHFEPYKPGLEVIKELKKEIATANEDFENEKNGEFAAGWMDGAGFAIELLEGEEGPT